jgi:hypothetical protein
MHLFLMHYYFAIAAYHFSRSAMQFDNDFIRTGCLGQFHFYIPSGETKTRHRIPVTGTLQNRITSYNEHTKIIVESLFKVVDDRHRKFSLCSCPGLNCEISLPKFCADSKCSKSIGYKLLILLIKL